MWHKCQLISVCVRVKGVEAVVFQSLPVCMCRNIWGGKNTIDRAVEVIVGTGSDRRVERELISPDGSLSGKGQRQTSLPVSWSWYGTEARWWEADSQISSQQGSLDAAVISRNRWRQSCTKHRCSMRGRYF